MKRGGWSRADDDAVARLVRERTGLAFGPTAQRTLAARIRRASAARSVEDPSEYLTRLASEPETMDALLAELTIGETYFFREPGQLDHLRREVFPSLVRRCCAGGPVRVWSAGCATGEEAYTLAILLREAGLADCGSVIGTDLAPARLAVARRGVYTRWSLRGVPEATVKRYFQPRDGRFELDPRIRAGVRFSPLNLAEDGYPSLVSGIWQMDLVLCRNVLIYLDTSTISRIAPRLIEALSPEGWLVLGASDPLLTQFVPCEVVTTGAGVAYRRPRHRPSPTAKPRTPVREARPRSAALAPAPRPTPPAPRPTPPAPAVAAAAAAPRAPGTAADWLTRVRSLADEGKLAEAGRACVTAQEHHRTNPELLYLHAVLLAAAGRHEEAAAAARRALYLDRGLAVAHLLLGDSLQRVGDLEGATRALRNAERILAAMPADEPVPASGGEQAGRLAEMARLRLRLAEVAA